MKNHSIRGENPFEVRRYEKKNIDMDMNGEHPAETHCPSAF